MYTFSLTNQRTGITSCSACPANSNSPAGSDYWDDCICNTGFVKEYKFSAIGAKTGFDCYCNPGSYVSGTECVKCQLCGPGYYKDGCEKASAGVCKKCEDCLDPLQKRAGCGYFSAGVCKDKTELVRTPFCPVEVEEQEKNALAISVRQASGLGAFSFEQVFGTDAAGAAFVCSTPCDGVDYDSIQCDGPFACNVKTCAEKMEPEGNMIPVRACPVVIEEDDSRETRQLKRRESCVKCNDCGHVNKDFGGASGTSKTSLYHHWGGGCVRECSKLLCSENMIWDWTARKCKECADLRSMELCNMRDRKGLNLTTSRSVTGHWPLLHFPECGGNSAVKKLETFTYGRCVACNELADKRKTCTSGGLYPAACQDGGVLCRKCHRAGRPEALERVSMLEGLWYNSRTLAWEPLHCQISACLRREDQDWTGVGEADGLCTRACSRVACAADQVEVACRLPHDARCEQVFPAPGSALSVRSRYVDGEVNLLNAAGDDKHRRFASFENTLVVLDSPDMHEFQCVWNADGIFDNQASPGGLSNVLWARGRSDDAEYEERGTQACREWRVERGEWMPLLPLQNTISTAEGEDSSRRMLVNTEAYVLSYRFAGAFFVRRPLDVAAHFTDDEHGPRDERMLRGAHVGGAGRLFLMMILHEEKVTLAVNVPTDRSVHKAMWLQALLVSFAVVDLTADDRESSGLTVSASVTVDDKHVSDLDDNFVFESFWVQSATESTQNTHSSCNDNLVWKDSYDNDCADYVQKGWCLDGFYGPAWQFSWGEFSYYASDDGIDASRACCACQPQQLGNLSSLFVARMNGRKFAAWTRCSPESMLAAGQLLDLQIARFESSAQNYSWLPRRGDSIGLVNASWLCSRGETALALSECDELPYAAEVYVRREAYESPVSPATLWPAESCVGADTLCQRTRDPVLLSLLQVRQSVRGAPWAEQHFGSVNQVRYEVLRKDEERFAHMRQAHAWSPFEDCAVVFTSESPEGRAEASNNVSCVGSGGLREIAKPQDEASRFLGAFGYRLGDRRYLMLLLGGKVARSTILGWNDMAAGVFRVVHDRTGLSVNWVSVCVETVDGQELIAALGMNSNNAVEVYLCKLESKPNQLTAQDEIHLTAESGTMVFPKLTYAILEQQPTGFGSDGDGVRRSLGFSTVDPWMRYTRVVLAPDTRTVLVAGVTLEQVLADDGGAGGSRLLLTVCAGVSSVSGASGDTACEQVPLANSPTELPSFISAAALRRAEAGLEYWVVAVYGLVYTVITTRGADSAVRVAMQVQPQSDLTGVHFVKVDTLFYTFSVSGASTVGVLTYLPGFERLRRNTSQVLTYAVVVIPPSTPPPLVVASSEDTTTYTPPPTVLRLKAHYASYHVEVAGGPGLPVYELTGSRASGNESTELLVSTHSPAPFARHRAAFVATYEGSGINHRISLPHAFARYEMSGSECKFVHTTVGGYGQGLELVLTRAPERQIVLQFNVSCGGVLAIFSTIPSTSLSAHECPGDVLLVLDSSARQEAHYLVPGTDRVHTIVTSYTIDLLTVYMGAGVAWVNSVYVQATPAEVRRRLLRARQLETRAPPTPVGPAWQRERQVLTLNPVKNMRLELTFARRPTPVADMQVSAGVDDVQLAPVLSQVPPLRGGQGQLCTPVRVPSVADLAQIGLETLVASDHWARVHVTVGLQTQHTRACAYSVRLYLARAEGCPAAGSLNASGVALIGCELSTSPDNVRGAYQECQLQVPVALSGEDALGVVAWPSAAGPDACHLGADDSLVAFLRPHTAIYECPAGHFVSEGRCSPCHAGEAVFTRCPLGTRLEGCPALYGTAAGSCVACAEDSELVLAAQAHWVQSSQDICVWECNAGFYETRVLGKRRCTPCSPPPTCASGQQPQSCTAFADASCVTCPDLTLTKGFYAANEMFVDGCASQCRPGHYNNTERHAEGRCMRCWDRTELMLQASQLGHRFVAFFNCTATANARYEPCEEQPGSRLLESDPGAGTDSSPFTGLCVRECEAGYALQAGRCSQCPHPPRVHNGSPTALPLEASVFTWHRGSCNFTCLPPFLSTRARSNHDPAVVDTCVLCQHLNGSHLCPNGRFPAGPYCACDTCRRVRDLY